MAGLDCKEKFATKRLLKNCRVESIRIYGHFVNTVCLLCICNKELLIESEYFSVFFLLLFVLSVRGTQILLDTLVVCHQWLCSLQKIHVSHYEIV